MRAMRKPSIRTRATAAFCIASAAIWAACRTEPHADGPAAAPPLDAGVTSIRRAPVQPNVVTTFLERRLEMHPPHGAEGPLTPGLVFEMLSAHQRTAALQGLGARDPHPVRLPRDQRRAGQRRGALPPFGHQRRLPRPAVPVLAGFDRAVPGQPGHAGTVRPPGGDRPVGAHRAAGRRQRGTRAQTPRCYRHASSRHSGAIA
jgi:hypothetical protein